MAPTVFCMAATPFLPGGGVDEGALRAGLRRMVAANVGVYLGSGGAGEGHALAAAELRRVYEIGVEECRGRVPVHANPPEPRTASAMLQLAQHAVAANVDVVQLYPMDAGHAMRPTAAEQEAYYRDLLDVIDHPVALSVHVFAGYMAPIPLLHTLCSSYPQVVAINVIGTPLPYFVELKDAVGARVALNMRLVNAIEGVALGAQGFLAAEPNLVPLLCRSIVDRLVARDLVGAGDALARLVRFSTIVNRWAPSTARWVKMAMKVLDLPGGRGGLRKPYLMPPAQEVNEMAAAIAALAIDELAERAAPLRWNWLDGEPPSDVQTAG
jgi:4-hydroxy-tetrahydrodipicolinate synthase